MENSIFSIVPPLVAIFLAVYTKKIIPSLFLGVWLGATLLSGGNPFLGFLKLFEDYIVSALSSKSNATVLLYGAAFGGFIVILEKTGGAKALGNFFSSKAKSPRLAEFYTMLFGIFIFFDDYFSCLTVGSVMRPIFDRAKIAREKLAFLVDSTAAPICLLVPVSTWVVYVTGLISKEIENSSATSSILIYFRTIPINFYPILALSGVALIIFKRWSFSYMKKAEIQAIASESQAIKENEKQEEKIAPKISNLLIPLLIMLSLLPFLFLYTGGYWQEGKQIEFWQAIGNAKGGLCILISVVIAGGIAILIGKIRGYFTLSQGVESYMVGMSGMYTTYIILILAWALGSLSKDLGTAKYVSSLVIKNCPEFLIPSLLFLIGSLVSFTTGTSYGTFAILMPVAVPLAFSLGIPVEYAIAAVLSGGIFGDHTSPVSDTTILSATGAGCDTMSHALTQIPYALVFAFSSIVAFLILGFFHSILLAICVSALVLFASGYLFHSMSAKA